MQGSMDFLNPEKAEALGQAPHLHLPELGHVGAEAAGVLAVGRQALHAHHRIQLLLGRPQDVQDVQTIVCSRHLCQSPSSVLLPQEGTHTTPHIST